VMQRPARIEGQLRGVRKLLAPAALVKRFA
jgi:DNA-binding FrmR family transcriptional regulator